MAEWHQFPIPGISLRSRDTSPKQMVLPGLGAAQMERAPTWHMNGQQFNDHFRKVRSFDDLSPGESVTLQAYHGTSRQSSEAIYEQGFKADSSAKAVYRKHGLNGNYFDEPRNQLLSPDHQQGVYFAEHRHASLYGRPIPVEVSLKRPRIDSGLTYDDVVEAHPTAVAKRHDAWISRSGGSDRDPGMGDFDEHPDPNADWPSGGESYRQGVVYNPSQIKPVHKHTPLITPVAGARVRHRQTGETFTLGMRPRGSDRVIVYPDHSRYPDSGGLYEGLPDENDADDERLLSWKDLEVVGGHHDHLRHAINQGHYVPARAWAPDEREAPETSFEEKKSRRKREGSQQILFPQNASPDVPDSRPSRLAHFVQGAAS